MDIKAPPATIAGEVIPPGTLSLAERVNSEHQQLKECIIRGAHHAVRAGELLWEAKRQAGHGRWLEWITHLDLLLMEDPLTDLGLRVEILARCAFISALMYEEEPEPNLC